MSPQFDKAYALINQLARDMGVTINFGGGVSSRNKASYLYWDPPKEWTKTKYLFAYTPWKTKDPETGKVGFFALKYRLLKNGSMKLVKSVRFARRKIANRRAYQWYEKYYRGDKQ